MTSKTTNKFSPEVRGRAVRMVSEHEAEYPSRWATLCSIAAKIGCSAHTFNEWVKSSTHQADEAIELIEIVEHAHPTPALFVRCFDQHLVAFFGDIDSCQNGSGCGNVMNGHSGSPFTVWLCKTTVRPEAQL
ncbi:hypothetical protein RvVAR031_pl00720 (plasmid) [Agrobacterium vitis]|nr:hypothetical protein RvVAR031_pl00720 [Agrobacterium vitis]